MTDADPNAAPALSERQQADVRHRFANVFQLISALSRMRIQRAGDAETKRQLSWLLDAVGVLGQFQQRRLGSDPDNLGGFLQDMAPQWRRRCAGRPIQLDLTTEPVMAREHIASAVGLIANELVSNALAHAFADDRAGVITVQLRSLGDDRAELTVTDDGRGYDPGAVGPNQLGLWLIQGLSRQVRGEMVTTTEGGVNARLEFATQPEG